VFLIFRKVSKCTASIERPASAAKSVSASWGFALTPEPSRGSWTPMGALPPDRRCRLAIRGPLSQILNTPLDWLEEWNFQPPLRNFNGAFIRCCWLDAVAMLFRRHRRVVVYLRTVRLTTVDDSADMMTTQDCSATAQMTTTTQRDATWMSKTGRRRTTTLRRPSGTVAVAGHVDESWPQPTDARTDGRTDGRLG